MDVRSSAQDVQRCDLCETAIVHSYCDFCHVNLCKPCIGDHISDGYDKHKIVPFQERRSTLIYPKCKMHVLKNCEFMCTNCDDIFICSSCMASEQHRGHIFIEVSIIYKERLTVIENDIKKLENLVFSKHEAFALGFETKLANIDGIYDKLTEEITRHGEEWHREIDIIINNIKTETREMKEKHRHILQIYLNGIKQQQDLMKKDLLALKDIAKSNEVSQTFEYKPMVARFSERPTMAQVTLPTFKSQPIDRERLLTLFGQITRLSIHPAFVFFY